MVDRALHRRATAARRDRQRQQRRDEILTAARTIATAEGMDRLTVRDVALAASVSIGSVYLHFGSRDDLLAHLIIDGLTRNQKTWNERYARQRNQSLQLLAETYLDALSEHVDLFDATARLRLDLERAALSPSAASSLRDAIRAVITPFERTIIARAPHAPHPRRTAAVLWSALNGIMLTFARQPGRTRARERVFLHEQARQLTAAFDALLGVEKRKATTSPRRSKARAKR